MLPGRTTAAAARAIGMNERTARRYATAPQFRAELTRRTGDALEASGRGLAAAMLGAVNIAATVMQDTKQPPGVRLAAARLILDKRDKLTEEAIILARIEALEAQL